MRSVVRAKLHIESVSHRNDVDLLESSVGMKFKSFLKKLYGKCQAHAYFQLKKMDFFIISKMSIFCDFSLFFSRLFIGFFQKRFFERIFFEKM